MASNYPGLKPKKLPNSFQSPAGTVFENHKVSNMQKAFFQLPEYPDYLAARIPLGLFPNLRYTSKGILTKNNKLKNHFQGVQRLRNSNYLISSAGDNTQNFAQFYLSNIKSQSDQTAPFGSNVLNDGAPGRGDRLVEVFHLNSGQSAFWHAGGMALLGDVLAVPLENTEKKSSDIAFYNFLDSLKPLKYPFSIRRNKFKAGCVGLCRLANGFFLCAVWVDSEVDDAFFSFYISNSQNFDDGFKKKAVCQILGKNIIRLDRKKNKPNKIKYQAIQIIQDKRNKFYILGSENVSDQAPTIKGKNYIDLLNLDIPANLTNSAVPSDNLITITFNTDKTFAKCEPYGNFDAGVGAHVDQDGRLAIYSAYHWRNGTELKFTEFYQRFQPSKKITDPQKAWIELCEKPNFGGRRLKLFGQLEASISNYKNLQVQGKSFGNKVSSVVFQIPQGQTYRLYQDKHFNEHKKTLDLIGTGKVVSIENLKTFDFDNRTSSSAYQ